MPHDENWVENAGGVLIDNRNADELSKGKIEGALHIPCKMGDDALEVARAAALPADKSTPILVFCAVGGRSRRFQAALVELGYTNVKNGGGFDAVNAHLNS